MADEEDVQTPDSSPGEQAPDTGAGSSPVTQDVTPQVGDRPMENLQAEWQRKFTKVERQLADLAAYLAAQAQPAPQAPAPRQDSGTREPTDEELLDAAAQGNKDALRYYTQRTIAQQQQAYSQVSRLQQGVQAQLGVLYTRYPVLRDATHPLTQAALQVRHVLMQTGYAPGPATDLEAIKTAIADHPDLIAQLVARPQEGRRGAPSQDLEGATFRRSSASPQAPKLTQREVDIAKRMGVDPAKAKQRFDERQKKGQSSVTPTVALLMREES